MDGFGLRRLWLIDKTEDPFDARSKKLFKKKYQTTRRYFRGYFREFSRLEIIRKTAICREMFLKRIPPHPIFREKVVKVHRKEPCNFFLVFVAR